MTNSVLEKAKVALEKVETQPDIAEKYGGLDKGPATYGVVKKLRDNDMDLHTDRQVTHLLILFPHLSSQVPDLRFTDTNEVLRQLTTAIALRDGFSFAVVSVHCKEMRRSSLLHIVWPFCL